MQERPKSRKFPLTGEYEGQWIEIKSSATWGTFRKLQKAGAGDLDLVNETLSKLIVDWNLVDDDCQPLPKPHKNPDAFDEVEIGAMTQIVKHLHGWGDLLKEESGGDIKNFDAGSSATSTAEGLHPSNTPSS